MKKYLLPILLALIVVCNIGFAQVGIGTTTPDPSAMLDVTSTDKGAIFPRVSLSSNTDIVTIPNPAAGLLVYNTGTSGLTYLGYVFWDGKHLTPRQ